MSGPRRSYAASAAIGHAGVQAYAEMAVARPEAPSLRRRRTEAADVPP